MYELRSHGRLARRRRRTRILFVAALSLFGLHEAFHFADWLAWGLDVHALGSVRDALWPFFGAHDTFGYVSHAIVNLTVLVALGWALKDVSGPTKAN